MNLKTAAQIKGHTIFIQENSSVSLDHYLHIFLFLKLNHDIKEC